MSKCQKCGKGFEFMTPEDYEKSGLNTCVVSHSREYCRSCHRALLKEEYYIHLMATRDFRTIPNMEKAFMLSFGDLLPSNICFICGAKVDKDTSRYDGRTGTTWFNRCPKCTQKGRIEK